MITLSKYRIVGSPATDNSARVTLFMRPSLRKGCEAVLYQTCEVLESISRTGSVASDGSASSRPSMNALIASRNDQFTRMVMQGSVGLGATESGRGPRGGVATLDVSVERAREIAGMMGADIVCVDNVFCDLLTRDVWMDVNIFGTGSSPDSGVYEQRLRRLRRRRI